MATQELTFKISATDAGLKSVMAQARAEITATAQAQKTISQGELSMRQQLSAAASLQRQRSAALISDWKKTETAALNASRGVVPFHQSVTRLSDVMQGLSTSTAALQGPLGGIASRFSSLSSITDGLTTKTGAFGIALGVIATASAGAAIGIFKLVSAEAEATGKFIDLRQQVGFQVETLSALQNAAETSGGSIETVTGALGIFQKNMEAAHEKGNALGKVFKALNIDIDDNEKALRQAFTALAKMPEGAQQTATALKLFGRAGKDVLGIIKETGGDLDAFTEKLRQMGVLIDTQTAQAGDNLSDAITRMGHQFDATKRIIAGEFAPDVQRALAEVTRVLTENKDVVREWGQAFAGAVRGIAAIAQSEIGTVVIWIAKLSATIAGIIPLFRALRLLGGEPGRAAVPDPLGGASRVNYGGSSRLNLGGGGVGGNRGGGGRSRADTAAADALREQQRQEDFNNQLVDSYNKLEAEISGVDTATRKYAVEQAILNGVLRDADPLLQKEALANARLIDIDIKRLGFIKEITSYYKTQNAAIKEIVQGQQGFISQAGEFIVALEKQGAVIPDTVKFWLLFNSSIQQADATGKQLIDTLESMTIAAAGVPDLSEFQIGQQAGAAADIAAGALPPPPDINPWTEAFKELKAIGTDAMSALADGIGSLVQNWVLLGSAGPGAMRKLVASVLAGVAAQAAVMAIMELAYGIAALTPWGAAIYGPAPFHFKSAAMFGAVAVAAGIGGRLIAGDAFQGAKGGGAGGGGSSTGRTGTTSPPPVDINRRSFQTTQPQQVVVVLKLSGGLNQVIEGHVVDNWNSNGRIRTVIQSDGQG